MIMMPSASTEEGGGGGKEEGRKGWEEKGEGEKERERKERKKVVKFFIFCVQLQSDSGMNIPKGARNHWVPNMAW